MALTRDEIARMRMFNQRISAPVIGAAPDIVRWLGAIQAQDFAGAKWGVGLRLLNANNDQVQQDFTAGSILRTHVMRPTWHFVMPEDIRWLLSLTAPRVRTLMRSFDRQLGIDDDLVQRSNRCIERVLRGGEQRTREELRAALDREGIVPGSGLRLGNLVMHAELDGVLCSGPRKGNQFTYMLLEERVPVVKVLEREEALAELAGRFFRSRGPATVQDFAKWSGLTISDSRSGLEAVKDQLRDERVDEKSYWLPAISRPAEETGPVTHLMSVYDEYISGYQDHSAMIDPAYGETLRGLGNALVNIIVVDGQVIGAWRRTERKSVQKIELNPFRSLRDEEYEAVIKASSRYGAFFGKEIEVTTL